MTEFNRPIKEYKARIKSLQIDIPKACTEIQLVWLFELLMLRAFFAACNNRKIVSVNPTTGHPRLSEHDCFHAFDIQHARCINILQKYRDLFVHQGFSASAVYFDKLCELNTDVNEVCKLVGTTVCFDNRMF